jgi:NAD(P)-dependent dehydrogenase (short-subunit alcohol dehydrogenase family)
MSLLGKIAVITGGAKGIGFACCEALGKVCWAPPLSLGMLT